MEKWYKDLTSELGYRYPWIVCYTDTDGETHQEQVSGQSAQDVADYIRRTYHPEHIDFIAKLAEFCGDEKEEKVEMTCADYLRLAPYCKQRRGPNTSSRIALLQFRSTATETKIHRGYWEDLYYHGKKAYDSLDMLKRHIKSEYYNELLTLLIDEDKEAGCFVCDCDNCKAVNAYAKM